MLSDFYRSKKWENLAKLIKQERTNDEGVIICEYCGKPIVRKYDCIGHHKIPLSEANVNDVSISLNPDNIMLVHHQCHNRIHNKLGYTPKKVYLVYGSPCAGKNFFIKQNAETDDLIVDMDKIYECVSQCGVHEQPQKLKTIAFGVRDKLIEMIKHRYGNWNTAWVIGSYPLSAERERISNTIGAEVIFIDTDKATCIERLHSNPNGRDIASWEQYINDWWAKQPPPH